MCLLYKKMLYNDIHKLLKSIKLIPCIEEQIKAQRIIISHHKLEDYEMLALLFEQLLDESVVQEYIIIKEE